MHQLGSPTTKYFGALVDWLNRFLPQILRFKKSRLGPEKIRLSVPHLCSSRDNPSRMKVPILSGHPFLIGSAVGSD